MSDTLLQLVRPLRHDASGVEAKLLDALENETGVALPEEYRRLMEWSDGAQGFVEDEVYVSFYELEHVGKLASEQQFRDAYAGFLPIGSDGGGEYIALRRGPEGFEVGWLPTIGSAADFRSLGTSVEGFLREALRRSRADLSVLDGTPVDPKVKVIVESPEFHTKARGLTDAWRERNRKK